MVIYKITNKINNKVYIGQTIYSLKRRFNEHCRSKNSLIAKAIAKYGKENFYIEALHKAENIEEMNEKEIFYIKIFESTNRNKGYNVAFGGKNSLLSEETRKKLSLSHKGKTLSEEHKRNISKSGLGKKRSEITRVNMSKAFSGRKHSEETKQKISMLKKGKRPWNLGLPTKEETKNKLSIAKNSKKIKVLCVNNGFIYESINDAARKLNVNKRAIQFALMGKIKKINGLTLIKYVERAL